MKTIPMSPSELGHAILVDIMHNYGTTREQVRYRLKNSSQMVNKSIDNLIAQGKILYREKTGKMEITNAGLHSISG